MATAGKLLAMQIIPPRHDQTNAQIVAQAIVEIILGNPHCASLPFFRDARVRTVRLAGEPCQAPM